MNVASSQILATTPGLTPGIHSLPRLQWELRITSLFRLVHRSSCDHPQTERLGTWRVRPRVPAPELVHPRKRELSGVFCVAQGQQKEESISFDSGSRWLNRGTDTACFCYCPYLTGAGRWLGLALGGSAWTLQRPSLRTERPMDRGIQARKARHLSWGGGPVGNPSVLATCSLDLP